MHGAAQPPQPPPLPPHTLIFMPQADHEAWQGTMTAHMLVETRMVPVL